MDDASSDLPSPVRSHRVLQPGFSLKSKAFMMTFNSAAFALATWTRFEAWVKQKRSALGARAWSACLEETLHGQGDKDQQFHLHAYLLWTDGVGVHRRNLKDFEFEGVTPRIDKCVARQDVTPRASAEHGLWYVHVRKLGTRESNTNYRPWVHYKPSAAWLQGLWDAKKLTHQMYLDLSVSFRSGHSHRKRDLDEVLQDERAQAVDHLVAAELSRLQAADPPQPMRSFPEVDAFVNMFQASSPPRWRRPILVIVGGRNL
eukprot:12421409-Karenia_brevis.AAC.1